MPTVRDARRLLVALARKHSRVPHEAEDVAHDIVLAALRRGIPLDGDRFFASARASARQHSAFLARSALRRRAREASAVPGASEPETPAARTQASPGARAVALPPALQTTLHLLLLGLDKAEIRAALGVSDAALRKRYQALRGYAPLARPDFGVVPRTPTVAGLRRSQVQLLPRLLAAFTAAQRGQRALAAADPDGHGLIFAELLTKGRVAATTRAPDGRAQQRGESC